MGHQIARLVSTSAQLRSVAIGLGSLLAIGCAVELEPGWDDELSQHLVDRRELFAGGPEILTGFAELASDDLRTGDEALFGVCLDIHGKQRIWYLHVRVLDVETKRWLWYRSVHPYETRLRHAPDPDERLPRSLDDLASDMPVARIQVEVFDANGRSQGRASSELAVEQLMIGMRPACTAGYSQRELMRGRVALGEQAELLELDQLTDEQRRDLDTVGSGIGVCEGFFQVLRTNPVTRDLLYEVIALPTLWSMITHFGVRADVSLDFFAALPVPADHFPQASGELWSFPLAIQLNAQPALLTRVAVGPRGAPNAVAAGVHAVTGRHPTDPQRRLHMQVLATRRDDALR